MVRVLAHARKVGLSNTKEFTFRAFFMAPAHDRLRSHDPLNDPRFETEWKKFDLLVRHDGVAERALVLVYQRNDDRGQGRTFHGSYGGLEASPTVAHVWRRAKGPLEARVLVPAPVGSGEEPAALWARSAARLRRASRPGGRLHPLPPPSGTPGARRRRATSAGGHWAHLLVVRPPGDRRDGPGHALLRRLQPAGRARLPDGGHLLRDDLSGVSARRACGSAGSAADRYRLPREPAGTSRCRPR